MYFGLFVVNTSIVRPGCEYTFMSTSTLLKLSIACENDFKTENIYIYNNNKTLF